MATITLILADTAGGGVSVRSDFKPAVGHPVTPAQAQALDLIGITHKRWGKTDPADAPASIGLLGEHWGDPEL